LPDVELPVRVVGQEDEADVTDEATGDGVAEVAKVDGAVK
jgi:hypothetical protein